MNIKKILPVVLCFSLLLSMTGCGKEENKTTEKKNIVTTDFVTYDVTKNLIKDTDLTVEMINITDELSGRDRNKINNSILFINTEDLSKIEGIDENIKKLEISSFIESKENSSDDNKIYGENLNFISNDTSEDNNSDNNSQIQIIVNPNSNNNKSEENNKQNTSNTTDNKDDLDSNSKNTNQNNTNNNQDSNNTNENDSEKNSNQINIEPKGLEIIYVDSNVGSAPCSSDLNGKTLSSMEVGYSVVGYKEEDPYQAWICKRIEALNPGEFVKYAALDLGGGNYKIFVYDGGYLARYKVVDGINGIFIPDYGQTLYAESSLQSVLSEYETASIEKPVETEAKILASTVDKATDYWLDVDNTVLLSQKIRDLLIEVDPINTEKYNNNYKDYESELLSLDDKIQYAVDISQNKLIFIGGAFKYKYFTDGYGINYISIYDYSTQETSLTRLNNFAKIVNKYNIKYIIKDPLSSTDGIESIKTEVSHNINTVIIDTMEQVDNPDSTSYLEIMNNNYIILKKALY